MKFVAPLNAHVYMFVCIEVDTLLVESRLGDHMVEEEEEEDFICEFIYVPYSCIFRANLKSIA